MSDAEKSPAEVFDEFFGPGALAPMSGPLLERAAPRPGERVLDLACGTGTVALRVAPLVGPEGRVTAVDINPGMLAVGARKPQPAGSAPIEWREGDASALEFAGGAFDLILCQQGLQYFPDRAAATREMRRVLRPGGRAVLNTWQALEQHPLYATFTDSEVRHMGVNAGEAAAPFSFPDPEAIRQVLLKGGFEAVEVEPVAVEVRFPSADRFVYLTLLASSSFLDEFDWNDEALRTQLIENVSRDLAPVMARYRDGEGVRFPAWLNVAVAR
jgi:ubiquinone/menaquinone biosynthesis C-methylase UbiE